MKKLMFLLLIGLFAMSCSRKSIPNNPIPTQDNACDSVIQELIDSIKNKKPIIKYIAKPGSSYFKRDTIVTVDTSECDVVKQQALDIAKKYNQALKEVEFYKKLSESNAKKIINNNYTNSNNKNSQIGDNNNTQKSKSAPNQNGQGNLAQETDKGVNQNGQGNDGTYKPKDSQVGDGNTQTNNYDFWKGFFTCFLIFVVYFFSKYILKSYFPFLKFLP